MKAVVVYESLWGNTATIARAIAEGLGSGTQALTTDEATAAVLADADLVVVGAPVIAFSLPREQQREDLGKNPGKAPRPPDVAHPSMRSWLIGLPAGHGHYAAFETRLWWSLGGSTSGISRGLEKAGYRPAAKAMRFIVTGAYGPLREGEVERARQWGTELAKTVG